MAVESISRHLSLTESVVLDGGGKEVWKLLGRAEDGVVVGVEGVDGSDFGGTDTSLLLSTLSRLEEVLVRL